MISITQDTKIREYAAYLLEHHLDDLTSVSISRAKELKVPILKLFVSRQEELYTVSKEGWASFLKNLVTDTVNAYLDETIGQWRSGQMVISKDAINALDIIWIEQIRKKAFISWITTFSDNEEERSSLVYDAENLYSQIFSKIIEGFVQVQVQDLVRENEFIRTLLDNSPDGIFAFDKDLRVTAWNQALEKMKGLSRSEAVGKQVFDIYPQHSESEAGKQFIRVLNGDLVIIPPAEYPESGKWLEIHVLPLVNQLNQVIGGISILRDVTSIKEAEIELTVSKLFNDKITQLIPGIITVFNPETKQYIFVNDSAEKVLGYQKREIYAGGITHYLSLIHPEDLPGVLEQNAQALDRADTDKDYIDDTVVEFEFRIKDAAKAYRWLRTYAVVFSRDAFTNNVDQILNISIDITDKKLAEQRLIDANVLLEEKILDRTLELRMQQQRMNLTLSATKVGTWHCDLPFSNLIWSSQCKEHFGVPEDVNVTLDDFYRLVHADDREKVRLAIERSINDRDLYDVEFRTSDQDAGARWIKAIGRAFYKEGQPYRFDGITIDISEKREYEEELERKNRVLEIINNLGKVISAELDLKKVVQAVTDATTSITGAEFGAFFYNVADEQRQSYTLYAISGLSDEAFNKFPMPRNTHVFDPTFSGKGIVRSDDITKDPRYGKNAPYYGMPAGHLPVVSYMAVPVVSRRGEVLGGLFFGHSSPGKFSRQEEDYVLGIVTQAAIAIENSRLFDASKKNNEELLKKNRELQRINSDLDNFIYTASHDLKAPISNLEGLLLAFSDTVKEQLDDQSGLLIDMMNLSVDRLKSTISDLTEITKVQKSEEQAEMVDIYETFSEVRDLLRAEIRKYKPQIITDFTIQQFSFARKNLRSILLNLMSNSLKYSSPHRKPEISLKFFAQDESTYCLEVSDNGLGINPEFRQKMFQMFRRGHTHVEGSGVGLYILKRIIENADGTIDLESEVDKGTTFRIFFPIPGSAS